MEGGAGAGAAPPATPRSTANRILAGMDAAWHLPRYPGAAEVAVADAGACGQRLLPEEKRAWPLSRKSPTLHESRGILSRRRQLFHSNVFQRKPRGRSPTRKYVGARRAEHERQIEEQVAHLESKLRAILAEQDASDLVSYPLRGPGGAGAEESVGSASGVARSAVPKAGGTRRLAAASAAAGAPEQAHDGGWTEDCFPAGRQGEGSSTLRGSASSGDRYEGVEKKDFTAQQGEGAAAEGFPSACFITTKLKKCVNSGHFAQSHGRRPPRPLPRPPRPLPRPPPLPPKELCRGPGTF